MAYPLGLHDFQECFGKTPNLNGYRQVPQFLYTGEHDENDALLFDDAYSNEDRSLNFRLLGKPCFASTRLLAQRPMKQPTKLPSSKRIREAGMDPAAGITPKWLNFSERQSTSQNPNNLIPDI